MGDGERLQADPMDGEVMSTRCSECNHEAAWHLQYVPYGSALCEYPGCDCLFYHAPVVVAESQAPVMTWEMYIHGQKPVIATADTSEGVLTGLVPAQKYRIVAAHGYYPRRSWLSRAWHRLIGR